MYNRKARDTNVSDCYENALSVALFLQCRHITTYEGETKGSLIALLIPKPRLALLLKATDSEEDSK